MKEEMLEAIYGTVERLEQKVDELSASPKNTEVGSTPVPEVLIRAYLKKPYLLWLQKKGKLLTNWQD